MRLDALAELGLKLKVDYHTQYLVGGLASTLVQ